jgi:SAM-dependent methyltransferase
MTDDHESRQAIGLTQSLKRLRERARPLARRIVWTAAPAYARRRAARADAAVRFAHVESRLKHVDERYGEQIERLEDLARELILTAESLRRGIGDVDSAMKSAARSSRRQIAAIEGELNALPYVADSPFESLQAPVGEVLGYRSAAAMRTGSSGYVDFEELFRGSAARVAESQRPYLKLAREHQPVLDIGCGRGEFLALLGAEGVVARGVDSDAGMIERCEALGVEATLADANEYLQGIEDGSLGTVFSAQLIEHLPYPELQRMLALARRKLAPGGLFIAETVNPHRVSSLKTFWVDLTHQHPIFPEVALALSAIAGFESAYVFAPTFDSYERVRFLSPAYAVVAATPTEREEVG